MYSKERFVRRLLHCYNSGHLLGSTTYSAYTILLFFLCLNVFVCVQPAVLGGGGVGIYIATVSSTRNQIPYIIGRYFITYYGCQEQSTRMLKHLINYDSHIDQIPYCVCYQNLYVDFHTPGR
jgi:hypothetical protein